MFRFHSSFTFILYFIYTINALRWIKSNIPNSTITVIETSTFKSTPNIDVSDGVQVTIIKNTPNFEKGFNIYCFISGYNDKSEISFSFCKEGDCQIVKRGESPDNIKKFNFMLNFETNFPNKTGMKVEMKLTLPSLDYSGNYYCKANNGNFAITSNYIEIRDVQYWSLNLFRKIITVFKTNINLISVSNLPQVLNCSDGQSIMNPSAPRWTKIEFTSPFIWSVCPILKSEIGQSENNKMTKTKCLTFSKDKCENNINTEICPMNLNSMNSWQTFTDQNGDLIFTGLKGSTRNNIDSYSLMCYGKDADGSNKPLAYFYSEAREDVIVKGVTFDYENKPSNKRLKLLSPPSQEVNLYSREVPKESDSSSLKPITISALFESSYEARSVWKFGKTILNNNNNMKIDKYTVTFIGDISSQHAGTYTLEVTDKSEKIVMEVNVRVLGQPLLVNGECMSPLIYRWAGQDVNITCQYKQRPLDLKLQINSQEIKVSDTLENSKIQLKKEYAYLEMLNFTISPKVYSESGEVTISYNVFNVTRTLGQTQYQDHTVTFMASNDFGISVKSSSIYVVPRIASIVTQFPEKNNCTDQCTSDKRHTFFCEVRLEEYDNKELRIDHYWTINSNRLGVAANTPISLFTPYFIVNPVTKELTMLEIRSNNTEQDKTVKEYLKDNNIECHVDIFPMHQKDSTFKYYSTLDKDLGSRMKARITLDYVPLNIAYIYWIMTLILGILVLIILVVLVTRHCKRNKGETYQLGNLERKHGYNPEKEVQEKFFKPYDRQDQDSEDVFFTDDRDSRPSISGCSVGSCIDGELEEFNVDQYNQYET